VSRLLTTYMPMTISTLFQNKERLLQLAAMEATYQDSKTPISPEMVTLVIDTGASVTVMPYITYVVMPIRPVQAVEINGIVVGLEVRDLVMFPIPSTMIQEKNKHYF